MGDELDQPQLRELLEHSTDMVTRHAPDGTYVYASPASRQLLGYDPDELVGRSAYELFHPDDVPAIGHSHDAVLAGPELSTVVYRIRHRDGHYLWVETTSRTVRDADSGVVLEIQTSTRNVTNRMEAEGRLRESERRFRLAMAEAPIGMALVDLDGSWLAVNERLCELVGQSEEELLSLTFQDITHPDDLDADLQLLDLLLAGSIPRYQMEKRYLHADGHVVWIQLSVSLVRDDDERARYLIAHVQDITARRRRRAELRRVNAELERSNEDLHRFAAVASHDLRAPLATVRAILDTVLHVHADELSDEVADWMGRAARNTTRLAETVDALLDLARVSDHEFAPDVIALDRTVADVLEDLAPELTAAGARVRVEDLPTLRADPALLRVLVQNLVRNAIRFRAPERAPEICVRGQHVGDDWHLIVDDNGVGIEPADSERIFEPFARTSQGRQMDGVGIGLATCRRIVERHGGRITAEPLDEGARFVAVIPAGGAAAMSRGPVPGAP